MARTSHRCFEPTTSRRFRPPKRKRWGAEKTNFKNDQLLLDLQIFGRSQKRKVAQWQLFAKILQLKILPNAKLILQKLPKTLILAKVGKFHQIRTH